jgi:hypothetical protein
MPTVPLFPANTANFGAGAIPGNLTVTGTAGTPYTIAIGAAGLAAFVIPAGAPHAINGAAVTITNNSAAPAPAGGGAPGAAPPASNMFLTY